LGGLGGRNFSEVCWGSTLEKETVPCAARDEDPWARHNSTGVADLMFECGAAADKLTSHFDKLGGLGITREVTAFEFLWQNQWNVVVRSCNL
jgi:hypothetical protein